MLVLKTIHDLTQYLEKHNCKAGIFADTGFLYAISYQDDRLYNSASEVLDILSDHKVPIHANVISRMEFIDLIFRKQVTLGAIKLFNSLRPTVAPRNLFNLLKDIRDKNTASKKDGKSYKVDESRLKRLRKELSQSLESLIWRDLLFSSGGQDSN